MAITLKGQIKGTLLGVPILLAGLTAMNLAEISVEKAELCEKVSDMAQSEAKLMDSPGGKRMAREDIRNIEGERIKAAAWDAYAFIQDHPYAHHTAIKAMYKNKCMEER